MHLASTPPEIETLRHIGLFGGLDDASLALLAQNLVAHVVDSDEVVFRQGDAGCSVYLVESGEIELTKQVPDGRHAVVARLGEGMWFGEVAFLGVTSRAVSARAAEPTRLLELHVKHIRALYRHDVKAYSLLMMNLAREVCRKLQLAESLLVSAIGEQD